MLSRAAGHAPQLVHVASIGTAPLTRQAMPSIVRVIGQDAANAMPHFEANIAHEVAQGHLEWQLDPVARPVLHITIADLLYLDDANLLAGAPPTIEHLEIDLYKVVFAVQEAMQPTVRAVQPVAVMAAEPGTLPGMLATYWDQPMNEDEDEDEDEDY
ncbi:hypothetical protein SPRG_01465 [Saprolegnia parasitica CBS 223.65]|uniref:Uncharacterized protein n=1 Tax=Saprolegnia parasitica (strain CBS 223.65) TaxID=695850 RepID=A0A067CYJ6_SAPPC|nr:hypothetical protein SPRG_01465 [Saprolegnia parasitica CBS 223.65]KDO34330.1 hypothetical protein SPRG_01465 [Saprolegnia parasitica CBS 223.65]|eukprot:XP_012195067.1 hypothetical protein SPRG_01465 [Saprolegnia parasitica CBS 223.65]